MGKTPLQLKQGMATDRDFVNATQCPDIAYRAKIWVFWDLVRGEETELTRADFAQIAGVSTRELRRLIHAYNAHGIEGLQSRVHKPSGRKPLISDAVWREIIWPAIDREFDLTMGGFSVTKVHQHITEELGIPIKYSTLAKYLNRHGIRTRAPRNRPTKPKSVFGRDEDFSNCINEMMKVYNGKRQPVPPPIPRNGGCI